MAIDYFYNPSFMSVFTVPPKHMHNYWPFEILAFKGFAERFN